MNLNYNRLCLTLLVVACTTIGSFAQSLVTVSSYKTTTPADCNTRNGAVLEVTFTGALHPNAALSLWAYTPSSIVISSGRTKATFYGLDNVHPFYGGNSTVLVDTTGYGIGGYNAGTVNIGTAAVWAPKSVTVKSCDARELLQYGVDSTVYWNYSKWSNTFSTSIPGKILPGTYENTMWDTNGCVLHRQRLGGQVRTYGDLVVTSLNQPTKDTTIGICSGDSIMIDSVYYHINDTAFVYIPTPLPLCDTLKSIRIVKKKLETHVNIGICKGNTYQFPDGDTSSISSVDTSILSSSLGCDSIVFTNLIVDSVTFYTEKKFACQGTIFKFPDGDTTLVSKIDTSIIYSGACDTMVITDVEFVKPSYDSSIVYICQGSYHIFMDGDTGRTGIKDTSRFYTNNAQCDSFFIVDLRVLPTKVVYDTIKICGEKYYVFPNGDSSNTSKIDTSLLVTSSGCDSIVITNLVIEPLFIPEKQYCYSNHSLSYSNTGAAANPNSLSVDSQDLVYVAGEFYTASYNLSQSIKFTKSVNTNSEGFISCYNPSGNLVWAKHITNSNVTKNSGIFGLRLTNSANGDFIITGTFNGNFDLDFGSGVAEIKSFTSGRRWFIAKYNKNAQLLWHTQMQDTAVNSTINFSIQDLKVDNQGNILICGDMGSSVDFDPGPKTNPYKIAGKSDVFVTKYSAAGKFIWTIGLGGNNDDHLKELTTDGNNNIYISGFTKEFIDLDPSAGAKIIGNSKYHTPFFAKYNTNGNLLWEHNLQNTVDRISIESSPSGELMVASLFSNSVNLDSVTTVSAIKNNINSFFIAKYTALGKVDWVKTIGRVPNVKNQGYMMHTDITADNDQNIVFSGICSTPGLIDFDPDSGISKHNPHINGVYGPPGNAVEFVLQLNSNGKFQRKAIIDGSGGQIKTNSKGDVFLLSPRVDFRKGISINPQDTARVYHPILQNMLLKLENCNSKDYLKIIKCSPGAYTFPDGDTSSVNVIDTSTFKSKLGCDSIVITELIVSTPSSIVVFDTACGSYHWKINNKIYYKSGRYSDTLLGVNGCDTLATLNLVINNPVFNVLYDTICQGNTYYFPGGDSSKISVIDTGLFSGSNGCDSLFITNLTVNIKDSTLDTITTCNSYKWINGVTYTSSNNTATHKLTNSNGCDSIVTLNLTINKSNLASKYDSICQGNTYYFPDGDSSKVSSVDTSILTNLGGCDSTIITYLTVNQISSISAGNDDTICAGDTFQLNATGGVTYSWSPSTGLFSTNIANPKGVLSNNQTYTVLATDVNGCIGSDQVSLFLKSPIQVSLAPLNDLCVSDTAITLTGGTPLGGVYSGKGVNNHSVFDPAVAGVGTHTIIYSSALTGKCITRDSQNIVVKSGPIIFWSSIGTSCTGDESVSLSASPSGGTYSGNGIVGNNFNPGVAGKGNHLIEYSITGANGCKSVKTQNVKVGQSTPVSPIQGQDKVAKNRIYSYNLKPVNGSGYIWSVVGGKFITQTNNSSSVLWGSGNNGWLSVVQTNADGCVDSTKLKILISPLSQEDLTLEGNKIQLFPNPVDQELTINFGQLTGKVTLTLLDGNGKLVKEKNLEIIANKNETLNVEDLSIGTYYLLIQHQNKMVTHSVVVSR